MPASLEIEAPYLARGLIVVGVDEVGRGSLAGPVTVGAVALGALDAPPEGLEDSKVLSPARRSFVAAASREWALSWSLGWSGAKEIDDWGISVALSVAARRALEALGVAPGVIFLDGSFDYVSARRDRLDLEDAPAAPSAPVVTLVGGDARCASIAAASNIAKVERDALMRRLHETWPVYDWASNKGYGTLAHRSGLREHGPCPEHRRSWRLL